jgi:hypothetical protein
MDTALVVGQAVVSLAVLVHIIRRMRREPPIQADAASDARWLARHGKYLR